MKKIRKGDEIIVITGKYKGQRGVVSTVRSDNRLIVSGINLVKKHIKPNPQREIAGGIQLIESPIHISNVMVFNPKTQKGDRVGIKKIETETKGKEKVVRFFKSTNEIF